VIKSHFPIPQQNYLKSPSSHRCKNFLLIIFKNLVPGVSRDDSQGYFLTPKVNLGADSLINLSDFSIWYSPVAKLGKNKKCFGAAETRKEFPLTGSGCLYYLCWF
jgi:hypothetical protein